MDEDEIVENYDGFYFLQSEDFGDMKIAFFKFKDSEYVGEPVQSTSIGDMYHIAFFKEDESGAVEFDESFEAIFADPKVYIRNFAGSNYHGCVLRKTNKSGKWWDNYLSKAKEACIIESSNLKQAKT